VGEALKIRVIRREVNFFGSPGGSLRLLVHGPCFAILNRKEVEATWVSTRIGSIERLARTLTK
jgi:hypothetical protein